MTLEPADIEAVAERVAQKLRGHRLSRYGDAQAVCERFGVSADYVYAHANELGAIRLGERPKARLRFDLDEVERRLYGNGRPPTPSPKPRPRRRRKQRSPAVELIPF